MASFIFGGNMDCSAFIQSEETLELIVAVDEMENPLIEPECIQKINDQYAIWYYNASQMPPLSVETYSYSAIPKVFWLMDSTSLDVSGILSLHNQPTFSLRGAGTLVGIIDTGIDFTNPLFQDIAGNTRIQSIWDQTQNREQNIQEEEKTSEEIEILERFAYGVFYDKDQIDEALASDNPRSIVPVVDENGHGTFLASVAAGSEDAENDFVGAAPESELVVVKLKPAKQTIREFFYLPMDEPLYQESDIMAAVAYLEYIAERENKPLSILIGVGSNQGSHTGSDPLSMYLNTVGGYRGCAIVVAAGNEAATQRHFYGEAKSALSPVAVEINVEDAVQGFCMELWSFAPEQVRVVVQSPTGQRSRGDFPITEETQTTNYIFESTTLTVNYRVVGRESRDLLVFFRFSSPTQGIWTVYVYPQNAITGGFHMWLPIQKEIGSKVIFIRPNPDTTITTPSAARVPITVGAYDALNGTLYIESGRGYEARGNIKPDFCAPGVNVSGAGLRNNYVTSTGTSAAAAITTGTAALCLEWGILRRNAPTMNSVQVKNLLIRGCEREENMNYPNREWGYGKLDAYNSFQVLRE